MPQCGRVWQIFELWYKWIPEYIDILIIQIFIPLCSEDIFGQVWKAHAKYSWLVVRFDVAAASCYQIYLDIRFCLDQWPHGSDNIDAATARSISTTIVEAYIWIFFVFSDCACNGLVYWGELELGLHFGSCQVLSKPWTPMVLLTSAAILTCNLCVQLDW